MPTPPHKGDRVQLTPRAARAFLTPRTKTNWHTRQGTAIAVTRHAVFIQWDGRKTPDPWPHKAIETCTTEHPQDITG